MKALEGGLYKPLSESDIERINDGVLTVLEKAGVQVNTKTGREYFQKAGAIVDESTRVVKIPRAMAEDAIASAPHKLVLCGRDQNHDVVLEGKKVHFGTGGTALYVLDLHTGERRPSTNEDIKQIARLIDTLENVHVFTINVYPNDVKNINDVDINRFYSSLSNTAKHVMGGIYTLTGTKQTVEMASILAGGINQLRERPFVSFITLMISPLKIDDTYGEMACWVASQRLPIVVPSEPLCGTTSPVTLASNVIVHCAESLAGVIMTQLVNPGTPVIFGSVGSIADMRTLGHVSGAIERAMINAAVTQMAQFYQLPYYSTAGTSDAKLMDAQAAYESAMSNLLVSMAGANYIHDAIGLTEFDLTVSYEKLVIDNEIAGMCLRTLRGIEVTDETMAVDLICEVGAAGDFLGERHTVKHMRTEFFQPEIADRNERGHWEKDGKKDATQRAREKVMEILNNHQPTHIPSEIDRRIHQRFANIRK